MKKKLMLLAFLPLMFLLGGCPYNSKVALTNVPKTPLDKSLIGEWRTKNDKEPNDSSLLRIYEFNGAEYTIVVLDKDGAKTEVEVYRAFITPVAGKMLMSFESLKTKGEFNFFSYQREGEILKIKVVSDIAIKEQYNNPKHLAKAFSKKINDKDFFESELVFVRSK